MDPIEQLIGVKMTHAIAGIAGGMVRALLVGGGWMAAIASVTVGSFSAAYLTTPFYGLAVSWISFPRQPSTEHAIGFLVGLTAMLICEGFLKYARGWSKNPILPFNKP